MLKEVTEKEFRELVNQGLVLAIFSPVPVVPVKCFPLCWQMWTRLVGIRLRF